MAGVEQPSYADSVSSHIMAKKKRTPSDPAVPAPAGRSSLSDEVLDRSLATGTTVSTSEEILAVANDTATRSRRQPTYEEIAEAAYRRYLDRGATDGLDTDDWLAAERELSERSRE